MKRVTRKVPKRRKESGNSFEAMKKPDDGSNPTIEKQEDLSMAIVPYVAPVPLSEAYPETTEEEMRNSLAWLFRRFLYLFSKGSGTEDSSSKGKDSTKDPYEWMNDAFPGTFKEKKNIEIQKERYFKINVVGSGSSKKSKGSYDWKRDLFYDYSKIEKAQKLVE